MRPHPILSILLFGAASSGFSIGRIKRNRASVLKAGWGDDSKDSNQWQSSFDAGSNGDSVDWQDTLKDKQDGSFWSSFEPIGEDEDVGDMEGTGGSDDLSEDNDTEAWLDALAELSNEEVEFNLQEAERADKARQMEEWGFDSAAISNALGVATDTSLEDADEVDGMKEYRKESYFDDVDLETVESHTLVEKDENGEPIRTQMVYVDEHTCIGCTNCAMIAQSTFYMNPEHGRARVFSQWGDDDETIAVAIETCPVDCIHYVQYDELERLEVERRDQNINFKARLVSQAEGNSAPSHLVGGGVQFTAPQKISGNEGTRCSNCPSRGCADCPMYGVGKNPYFEKKEQERKARIAKNRLSNSERKTRRSRLVVVLEWVSKLFTIRVLEKSSSS